jgi:hypothetical protein
MPEAGAGSLPPVPPTSPGCADDMAVGPVLLLGVYVTARGRLNRAEHERRRTLGLGPVADPALLNRLLDLPSGEPVSDPVIWAETSCLPGGIVDRGTDGCTVTRLLEPPLYLADVVVAARRGRELRAVQDASLFAGFTPRWVITDRRVIPDVLTLEAKLFGVGLLDPSSRILMPAEPPADRVTDGWAWLLGEKTYRRWLKESGTAAS